MEQAEWASATGASFVEQAIVAAAILAGLVAVAVALLARLVAVVAGLDAAAAEGLACR